MAGRSVFLTPAAPENEKRKPPLQLHDQSKFFNEDTPEPEKLRIWCSLSKIVEVVRL